MTRVILSAIVELVGLTAVVVGFALIAPWLGWIGAGIGLVVVGFAIDPPSRPVP